jgi:hypothetical protein
LKKSASNFYQTRLTKSLIFTMPLASLRVNTAALSSAYTSQASSPVTAGTSVTSSRRSGGTRSSKDSKKRGNSKEKELQELKVNVSRFTRANDHTSALATLQGCTALTSIELESVPSSPSSQKQWQELEQEVWRSSKLILNQVAFEGQAVRHEFVPVLKALCSKLTESTTGFIDSLSVYRLLIIRLAPTTSSADSYFHLNAVLGTGDLLLQPVQDPHYAKTILGFRPTADLSLYESGGQIHAIMVNNHAYGLYRKSDLTSSTPWLGVVATVHERINLTTGSGVREVQVKFV